MSERQIVCADVNSALEDLQRDGFRIELIYPADDPHTADLSRGDERVRLTSRPDAPAIPTGLPPFVPEFRLTRAGTSPGLGRAGMLYRDLVPSRLGGRYIASHIAIPKGGPVGDWVHYHHIAFQMIYVRRGWVRVVYEDQGPPFVMEPGDFVLQPPLIRHRVLESSPGLEVVEVTAPALHATFADHGLELPNRVDPGRVFGDQRFLHHKAAEAAWTPFGNAEAQETGLKAATGNLANARTIRAGDADEIRFPSDDGELSFGFVIEGGGMLQTDDRQHELGPADSFVIPADQPWKLNQLTPDFRLLQLLVALPESTE